MADKKVLKPVSSPARQRSFRRFMTLDEKLKEIETGEEFGGVPSAGLDVYASRLLAALHKCREQRDKYLFGQNDYAPLIHQEQDDAELLKILEEK